MMHYILSNAPSRGSDGIVVPFAQMYIAKWYTFQQIGTTFIALAQNVDELQSHVYNMQSDIWFTMVDCRVIRCLGSKTRPLCR